MLRMTRMTERLLEYGTAVALAGCALYLLGRWWG